MMRRGTTIRGYQMRRPSDKEGSQCRRLPGKEDGQQMRHSSMRSDIIAVEVGR
jgi:hypothetical protein